MGHARALLGVTNPSARIQLLRRILEEDLSVRAVEALAATQAKPASKPAPATQDAHLADLERRLSQHLSTKVEITSRGKGGKLTIHWYSNEHFGQVMRKLGMS